jgi:tetratricopeptide (TPR) repeat protein
MVSIRNLALLSAVAGSVAAQTPNPLLDTTKPPVYVAERPAPPAAVELTPEKRGDIFMARKMYREAIEMYRQAPQDSAIVWNKMGIGYHQMMQLDTAKKHYEKALKLNKNYAEARNNLGTVQYAKKSYRRAIGEYKKALKLAPLSASIYSNLGTAHFARKKYKDALLAYSKALELDPDVFEHRNSYGVLLQERSVEERAKFHYYLAKTYAGAQMFDRALQYLRKALEEGFKDKDKLKEEPEFAALQENPEFQQLLAMEPRVL